MLSDVRLIALDMDGTLLSSDHHTIPQGNVDAIREADAEGIRVCICTGRMIEDAGDFVRRLGLPCMIIGADGARACDAPLPEGNMLLSRSFSPEDAQAVLDIALAHPVMVNVFEDGLVSTVLGPGGSKYHLVARALIDDVYGEEKLREAAARGASKIYIVDDHPDRDIGKASLDTIRREITQRLAHLQVSSSDPTNIEVTPPDVNKGTALAALAAQLGLTAQSVMAMGDALNDEPMLRFAVHSVAMANADPRIKAICRHETESNDACGVAKMIRRVIAAHRARS